MASNEEDRLPKGSLMLFGTIGGLFFGVLVGIAYQGFLIGFFVGFLFEMDYQYGNHGTHIYDLKLGKSRFMMPENFRFKLSCKDCSAEIDAPGHDSMSHLDAWLSGHLDEFGHENYDLKIYNYGKIPHPFD